MVLKITVKTLDSQNYQFEVPDDWTISQFKEHIQDTVSATPNEQRLLFCGRVLRNDQKLSDYDCHEKVMHMVKRPPPIDPQHDSSTNEGSRNENEPYSRTGDESRLRRNGNILFNIFPSQGEPDWDDDMDRRLATLDRDINSLHDHIASFCDRLNQAGQPSQPFRTPITLLTQPTDEPSSDPESDQSRASNELAFQNALLDEYRIRSSTSDLRARTENVDSAANSDELVSSRRNLQLVRYMLMLNRAHYLYAYIQDFIARYRDAICESYRNRPITQPQTNPVDQTNVNQNMRETTSATTLDFRTQQNQILIEGIPWIMHTMSHILHHLSDVHFSQRFGALFSLYEPGANGNYEQLVASILNSNTQNSNPNLSTADNHDNRPPLLETSVTITATTVETNPVISTSVSGFQPQARASISVTSPSGLPGVHIPISIPLLGYQQRDIPSVPPPTQEQSRDPSLSRNDSERQPNNRNDSPRQPSQETASTQTFNPLHTRQTGVAHHVLGNNSELHCGSLYHFLEMTSRRPQEFDLESIAPRRFLRQSQDLRSDQAEREERTQHVQASQQHSTTTIGFPTLLANIIDPLLRQANQSVQSMGTFNQQGQQANQPGQSNQDPILSMIPDLAIYAAGQIVGGLMSQVRASDSQQESQPSSTRQAPIMMDIEIDDESDNNSFNQTNERNTTRSNQIPTQQGLIESTSNEAQRLMNCDHQRLVEVILNHPEWLPIIENEISNPGPPSSSKNK